MNRSVFNEQIPQTSAKQFNYGAVLLGLSVFLILAIFQPFGTYTFQRPDKLLLLAGYGIIITLTALIMMRVLRLIFDSWFDLKNWSLIKELIVLGIITLITIIATYFYHYIMIGNSLSFSNFLYFMFIASTTAVFPLLLIVIIRYMQVKNYLDRQYLVAELAPKPDVLVLEGENKTEKLTLVRSELLFIKAADNYVELYLNKNNRLDRHLLRGTLSGMTAQLDEDFLQVHRSYIVNLNHVTEMSGKSPNYQLVFENLEETVPVSRNKIQEVRQRLAARPV